jgi:hypothetical protein
MSKQTEKKIEETAPPLDIQTEIKMLSYTVSLRDQEIGSLTEINKNLKDSIIKVKQEKNQLRQAFVSSLKTEKTIKNMQEIVENLEKECEALREQRRQRDKEFEQEKEGIIRKYELDISGLKSQLEINEKRIEGVNNLQHLCEKQEEQIKQLEWEKEKLRVDADDQIKRKEIRNQVRFQDLKSKMMSSIEETQKNVQQLNLDYMDVSTKLILLQNHQLLIELEYQSQQIEELIKKKENLEKKVFELTQDIEVHKEVELALASKNKKYSEMIKNQTREDHESVQSTFMNNESPTLSKPLYVNQSVKEFTIINILEKKILKLEAALKKKGDDFIKLKNEFDYLEERLKNYEKKFANVYYLFEEGLKRFSEDEELNNNKDIFINLESIKKCEFSNLSNKEQYSVIVLLMKYLIPLLNPQDLRQSEFGNDNVNIKYQVTKKYMEDPMLKKVLSTNKKTMLHSIRRSIDNLPQINSIGKVKINFNQNTNNLEKFLLSNF